MARLNFVRGSIKGRVGEFVGSSWKGTDYIKTFTPPSNPKTENQVAVRSVFQHIIHIASQINPEVLKPYTFPKPHKMTPINRMVHINQALFAAKTWEPAHLHLFDGPLFNPGITSAAVENSGTPTVQVKLTFSGAGGPGTDTALAVIYDEISQKAIAAAGERQHCQIIVPLSSIDQADLSALHAYLVFSQSPAPGTPEPGQVSSTAYAPVSVPAP